MTLPFFIWYRKVTPPEKMSGRVKKGKSSDGLIHWLREGKRLNRLTDPAQLIEPGFQVLGVYSVYNGVLSSAIIQQSLPSRLGNAMINIQSWAHRSSLWSEPLFWERWRSVRKRATSELT